MYLNTSTNTHFQKYLKYVINLISLGENTILNKIESKSNQINKSKKFL